MTPTEQPITAEAALGALYDLHSWRQEAVGDSYHEARAKIKSYVSQSAAELIALRGEVDRLREIEKKAWARAEHDQVENFKLNRENTALKAEIDGLTNERDAWREARGITEQSLAEVTRQRDGLWDERAALKAEISEWQETARVRQVKIDRDRVRLEAERAENDALKAEVERLREALNTPEVENFAAGVVSEAQHQRERWGASHDAGKAPLDWFWLIGYLAQKAATAHMSGDVDKAKHHAISTAAALANWHAAIAGDSNVMRPGIDARSALGGK